MTIITAVKKDNEIAIACDTQSLSGSWQVKYTADYKVNSTKLLTYGENIFGFSGNLAIYQIFEDLFSETEPVSLASRAEILRWFLDDNNLLI